MQHVIGYIFLGAMLGTIGFGWIKGVWNGKRGDDYNG